MTSNGTVPKTRLNLGCGLDYREGWINVDHDPRVRSDISCDVVYCVNEELELRAFDLIVAHDIMEHLSDPVRFLDGCWNLLKPDGVIEIRVPHATLSHNTWLDPTHRRGYLPESFHFFDPDRAPGGRTVSAREWRILSLEVGQDLNVHCRMTPRKEKDGLSQRPNVEPAAAAEG